MRSESREPESTPFLETLVLHQAIDVLLAEAMRESPLSPRDYAVTSLIGLHPGISATALASELSVPLTTVMEWLSRLVEAGYVERRRDPDDGRRRLLALTDASVEPMREAHEQFGRAYRAFLSHAPRPVEESMTVLRELTRAVRAAADDLWAAPGTP